MKSLLRIILITILMSIGVFIALAFFFVRSSEPPVALASEAPREPTLDEVIDETCRTYSVDPSLCRAVIAQESGFRVDSIGPEVSNKGKSEMLRRAHGLFGILGSEAERRGIPWPKLYEPRTNIEVGSAMLASCIETAPGRSRFDKISQGLACFYSGRHKITTTAQSGGPSVKDYVTQVLWRYIQYKV